MSKSDVNGRLATGVIYVTPTRRLAHYLRARHDAACIAAQLLSWPTPDIVTWSDLIQRAFAADRDAGRNLLRWLEPSHSQLAWEHIVRADARLQTIIAPVGIGAMAQRSWALLHAYRIPAQVLDVDASPEVQAFAQWSRSYARWLRKGHWQDAAVAPDVVGAFSAGTRLCLVGFDSLTPQQEEFFARMAAAGSGIERGTGSATTALVQPSVVTCNDLDDELETAARWAAQRLHDDPGQQLAIIVRGLAGQRPRVRRILDRVLAPATTIAGGPAPESMAYELAAARPLAERPVVAAMLQWIALFGTGIDFAARTAVLRNPFDRAFAIEGVARAALDAWLRRNEPAELDVLALELHAARRACPEFAALLRHGRELGKGWQRRRLPSQWVREFTLLAATIGWPGVDANSAEHQAIQRWHAVLAQFGASDDILGAIAVNVALSQLRELATTTLFEPQEIRAPLLVIDPETSAGMRFDAAWLVGLEATHWPPPATPDPFLPREWQVRRNVPGASAEITAAGARHVLDRFRRDAGELILSVPAFEDEAPLLPSPLLSGYPPAEDVRLWPAVALARSTFAARPPLDTLRDGELPGIATHDVAHGGAKIIELQAACPFRAAAELRLGAREFQDPAPGIEASQRGNVAHAVLKALWDEVRTQHNLGAMSRDARLALVQRHVERELAPLRASATGVLSHLLQLEARWLEARVMELLDADLARPPFTVEHAELESSVDVGGLQVRLKLDRVDRLADGSLAIIDYKTGASANPGDWMGERPRSPQLPLYVRAVHGATVNAVAFGRVRTGATEYAGYVSEHKLFPELTGFVPHRKPFQDLATWGELLAAWDVRLDGIASEFAEGDARLAPDPRTACLRCHLPGLCRIGATRDEALAEDVDDGL